MSAEFKLIFSANFTIVKRVVPQFDARLNSSLPSDGLKELSLAMNISPSRFRHAFDRFQSIHRKACGLELESFGMSGTPVEEWEGYKRDIPRRAREVMSPKRWKQSDIGSGIILKSVIQAIELPGNNLLQWQARKGPDSQTHRRVIAALSDSTACRDLETVFFALFKNGDANRATFGRLVELCGQRYDLLGYLFFIAAPERFLPIRPDSFDKALEELGVDLRTSGQASWENYLAFVNVMQEVQRCLHAEGIADARLLDAHSFCWILARHQDGATSAPLALEPATMRAFSGQLRTAEPAKPFTPRESAEIIDMAEEAEKRRASGQIAEEIALNAEKQRLIDAGHADLAASVESVSDRPGLGYDIRSVEIDGTERFIEVKNVTNGNRFFLSENERLHGQNLPNYWFYLVSRTDSGLPHITCLSAKELTAAHLQPTQYLVRFDP